jgi:DNA-binding SARP family transcriptional activator
MFGVPGVARGGRALAFPTKHAEKALFCLLATPGHVLDAEVLGERLWPDAPLSRLGPRLSTMTWQLRGSLGGDAWRMVRRPGRFEFAADGVEIDLLVLRRAIEWASPDDRELAALLERPVLVPWADEDWVHDVEAENTRLLDQLRRG